ncbi:MAG TPA: hypothetical protein HPP66_13385, partial [Planctomycetes bacterium]|nr:hypothetical protein [Planctomycetota bacterium]
QTTSITRAYTQQSGYLQVTISTQAAIDAGAQWQVDNDGVWRNSGDTVTLSVGTYTVEYSEIEVEGEVWTKPPDQIVQINENQTTTTIGTYNKEEGASLIISEFMASNASAEPLEEGELLDGNDESSDWLEIYNPTDANVSLDGWYLTDSNDNWTKWQFPDGLEIGSGGFLIVFASDKTEEKNPDNYPYRDPDDYYHTNFNLNKEPGEYLALVAPDGNTIIHEYTPEYPVQLTNISYGLAQYATTLVQTGATATYHVPTIDDAGVGTDWTDPNFGDSGWHTGETGLGFGSAIVETGQDIGTPSAAGSYSVVNGVYTIEGDGEDIWGDTDDFYYVYTPLKGDGEIIAQVVSIEQTNDWAKAGVMIREQLTDTSSHAMMIATPPAGTTDTYAFQWVNGATRDQNIQGGDVTLPSWVKIVRTGDDFTGFYAPDMGGSPGDWVQLSTTNISMAEDVYIGLCVTSHSDGVLCTAVFDNVTRTGQISTNLQEQMLGINASLWTRIEFDLEEGQSDIFDTLMLRMQYEDGFTAYLNGQPVARRNAPNSVEWNSTALSDRLLEDALVFEEINIMAFVDTLHTGRNVLAIHGLNDDKNNDEFLILPELVAASNISVPQYFLSPTPEAFNIAGAEGIVSDVWFSESRGFYDSPFPLMLSTAMDDAEIRYTFDGSRPTIMHGLTYTGPFDVNETSTIRAVAVKPGWLDSAVETHTYIFLDDVVTQSPSGEPPGPNWPSAPVNNQVFEYGMDLAIVNHAIWGPQLKDALKAIPTMSIVTDLDNLFDPGSGIYVNAGGHGYVWERPTSLELIHPPNPQGRGFPDLAYIHDANGAVIWGLPLDMRDGFQTNAGLRIRGGYSRSGNNPKHAFRLFFRSEYGAGKLNYPLFGSEGVDAFDKVDLRTAQNYSWSYANDSANAMCRDVWARDTQGLLGQAYTRSRYYHLYINGHYWGIFQTQERPEAAYGASYFGGDRDDWDCVKATGPIAGYTIEATDGTLDYWEDLWDIANLGFTSHENYYRTQGLKTDGTRDPCYPVLLDVDNLIDYMMMVFYDGDRDAPISNFLGNTRTNNWFSVRNQKGQEGFRYFVHDAEHIMSRGLADRTGPYPCGDQFQYSNPQWIHQELMAYPDYRLRFADHAYKHLFNEGPLTADWAIERFQARAQQIDMAIIAESARWGSSSLNKDTWQSAINNEINNLFPNRSQDVVDQFKTTTLRSGALAPLYPSVEAPSVSPPGGWDLTGFNVTMSAPSGTIYYTTDGNDPRLPVVESAPGGTVTLVAENATQHYLVPTSSLAGSTGSILCEYWTGITGTAVSDLTSSPDYPGNPSAIDYLTTFETPTDWADYYGARLRGYLHPPTNGSYTFWISSDDASELWLSTDEDPSNAVCIAYEDSWSPAREWQTDNEQSAPITLAGGQKYYIEALMKEGGGGDNLAVAWEDLGIGITQQIIDGSYLSPAGDTWSTNYFDDSNWPSGTGGVGYEKNTGDPLNFIDLFNINVEGDMYGQNGTCYIRIPFTVSHTDLADMTLKIRYDDGFVAYINGTEVARRNFSGAPQWDSTATSEHPDSAAVNFEYIDISGYIGVLQTGSNVLAIQGMNISTSDSDFLISAELVAAEISQGDVSPGAIPYTGTVPLTRTTKLKARVLDGAWSALNEAIFAVGPVAENLRITEIMYHPHYTGDPNDPNTEFIELKNTGPGPLYLNLVEFTEGIHFTFPDIELASGEHIVVVNNIAAFDDLYCIQANGIRVAGEYSGSLANNGERLRLQDAIGRTILDFEYEDGWRPITDGDGFSLTIIEATYSDVNSWSEKDSWRASVFYGGSPGWDDSGILPNPGAVVINEVMSHSHDGPDWIELHNTTNKAIDIGGWFLSDSDRNDANLMKYRIPDGKTIAKNNYTVFYEDQDFNNPGDPCCIVPFGLSENGDKVCLSSPPDQYGMLTGCREMEDFGAAQTNVSFGRYFKSSTGNFNFVAMDFNTPWLANLDPKVGPIVINEIMYNPTSGNQNEEYIELYNTLAFPVTLYRVDKNTPWRFTDGIDYTFPASSFVTIYGHSYLLVVKDEAAFTARYGSMGVQVIESYDGWLSNAGESVELSMPGDMDELGTRYYIRIDRVNYSDGSHPEDCPGGVDLWPTEADGLGKSLSRKVSTDYGNDVINWKAAAPSPGTANP